MSDIAQTPTQAREPTVSEPLGYGMFLVQFASVVAAYLGAQIVIFGIGFTVSTLNSDEPSLEALSLIAALASPISAAAGVFVAWLWLRRSGRFREALGMVAIENWPRTLGVAALVTGGIIAIFAIGGAVTEAIGLGAPDVSQVMEMVTASPALFALWIVAVAWLGAGLGEELLWRGFLQDRLMHLPGIGGSMPVALVFQAIIFGLAHVYQGWGGVLITGAVGLLLGWVRLRMGGAIWAAVFAHAAVDTIMLSLGFASEYGWIAN